MKKSLLLIAAICAALTINSKEIVVDLSTAVEETTAGSAVPSLADGVLTVSWTVTENWEISGVEFPLNNLEEINGFKYEFKGDGGAVGVLSYVRDSEGNRWWDANTWITSEQGTWLEITAAPSACLWDGASYKYGTHPFIALGFIANPGTDDPNGDSFLATGKFYLKNVKLIVPDDQTSLDNTSAEQKTNKVIRDGQIMILRDGKTFNALGTEIK